MLKKIHNLLLKNIDTQEYILYQKSLILLNFSIIIAVATPFILLIYNYFGRLNVFLILALGVLFILIVTLQIILYHGYIRLYTHLLLILFLATAWVIIFIDSGEPLPSRIDTVIYSIVVMLMTPMAIFKRKWIIFIYYGFNILLINSYALYLHELFKLSSSVLIGFILDANIALILMSLISYNVYNLYLRSLKRAQLLEADTGARNMELLKANKELGHLNEKLSLSGNELKESEERYRLLYQNAPVGMGTVTLSDGKIFRLNHTAYVLLGLTEEHDISLLQFFDTDDDKKTFTAELLKNGELSDRELKLQRCDGTSFWGAVTARLYPDQLKAEIVFTDISKRKIAENYIHQLTFFDSLTGLPNKKLFVEHIFSEIRKTQRKSHGNILGIVSISIDGYKNFSDIHDTSEANRLLREVSRKIKGIFRDDDMVARFEANLFMVLLNDVSSPDDIKKIIHKIFKSFELSMTIGSTPIKINLNCGVSIFPGDGATPEQLIKNSELALYMARKQGRNKYHLFDAELNDKLINQILIEEELQQAIIDNLFTSYYQPRISSNGKVVSAESLIRWFSPTQGIIMPNEFIPIAEKTGMIKEIGRNILHQSCLQLREWSAISAAPFSVSVNVSPVELNDPAFIKSLTTIVSKTGIDPKLLELELTEQSLMFNQVEAIEKINEIHNLGIKIAIDDFGTGYSSLSKLKDMPIDIVKIDKSFIDNVPSDEKAVTIVTAMINLAKSLGFSVVVEGVETGQQLEFLNSLDIDEFQGYYFSRPLSPEDFNNKYFMKDNDVP